MRESMSFDVLIVGAGPAGLAAAIRLKQMQADLSVCVIEKAGEIGAHTLSGAVIDPHALSELFPDWTQRGAPLKTPVREDRFLFLSRNKSWRVPEPLLPACLGNDGNFIASLGELVRWLGQQAEALGVEIYAGFAGAEILFDESGAVCGVATGDMGVGRDGQPTAAYQPGMELRARYTLFAEGCRGHLGKQLEEKFHLRGQASPQTYGIGIKELWQVRPENFQSGLVLHSAGWPLQSDTHGGSFCYHYGENLVAFGMVIGTGYTNPYLSPFEEMQRLKTHPAFRLMFEGGKRIAYGARALTEGGLQALPQLIFPGGALIGDDAGFLNAARIKGTHAAMKSGLLAAQTLAPALAAGRAQDLLSEYPQHFRASWLYAELHKARNFKPLMNHSVYLGALLAGFDQLILRGRAPWTLRHRPDHTRLRRASVSTPIAYPKPDGVLTFDRLSSVFLSNTHHEENQPCHLRLRNAEAAITHNLALFDAPEQRYCPAGVYEIVRDSDGRNPRLQINAANCVHCKTCDIKDPGQNIQWVAPQGGEGPIYSAM